MILRREHTGIGARGDRFRITDDIGVVDASGIAPAVKAAWQLQQAGYAGTMMVYDEQEVLLYTGDIDALAAKYQPYMGPKHD